MCVRRQPEVEDPWLSRPIRSWNITSPKGKEPELLREVERYQLHLPSLILTHGLGSGASLREGLDSVPVWSGRW